VSFPVESSPWRFFTITDLEIKSVAPSSSVTSNVTVYVPFETNLCFGFLFVEVPPSPKFQK